MILIELLYFSLVVFIVYNHIKMLKKNNVRIILILFKSMCLFIFGVVSLILLSNFLKEMDNFEPLTGPMLFGSYGIVILIKNYKLKQNDIIGSDLTLEPSHINQNTNKIITFEYPYFNEDLNQDDYQNYEEYLADAETWIERSIILKKEYDEYFEGFCSLRNANRTFKKERVLRYLNGTENNLITTERLYNDHNRSNKLEITFIGFKKEDKEALIKLAQRNKMYVTKSISKRLFALVIGSRDAPLKREQAQQQGAYIMNEVQFKHFIKTGEI